MSEVQRLLQKLISFRTVCKTDNVKLIDFIQSTLETEGIKAKRIPGEFAGRASLIASVGPATSDGIVLSAHSDVVPVEGQPWTSDPFELTEKKDGKLVGRGSSDMKGFLACMIMAIKYAKGKESHLKRPLHLSISYDEEIGCVGIHSLLRHLAETKFKAAGCIIGEPTMLQPICGHKGKLVAKVKCYGVSAHSSNPALGCSAISMACDFVKEVEKLQEDLKVTEVSDKNYAVSHSTVQVGTISGGVAVNLVPDYCELDFEMRVLPGSDAQNYLTRLQKTGQSLVEKKYAGSGGRIEVNETNAYPALKTKEDEPFLQDIVKIVETLGDKSQDSHPGRISFGTEGGLFTQYLGIPTVICGPGSIDRAHKADEYIYAHELLAGEAFVKKVVDSLV